jgi:hypothetical protein
MKIGIDVDDVCVNFQKRFVALLNQLYGKTPLDTHPCNWEFSNSGCTVEEIGKAWKASESIPNWWLDLEPLPSFDDETIELLNLVILYHDVYFVTNRYNTADSESPMKQTKRWFVRNAGIAAPNVMIAKDKGPMATVLELDAFIDDRPKNCIDVLKARPNAHVFLADSSHNQTFNDPNIPRVKDLKTFLKLILSGVYGS